MCYCSETSSGKAAVSDVSHLTFNTNDPIAFVEALGTWANLLDATIELMFLFSQPSTEAIQSFLDQQRDQSYSYPEVGASRLPVFHSPSPGPQPSSPAHFAPTGYNVDHNRQQLGTGRDTFLKAVHAIQSWKMFDLGWCQLCWPDTPIEAGRTIAVVINHYGFWSLNACRIVYVINEEGPVTRYGFAYGTLPEHGEMGEERFSVEWDHSNDEVWYDLYAFSRPRHILARIAYPLSRNLQRRFARESKMAMVSAVNNSRS
jgi:uncharacterized protein (UPF0548 family)